MEDKADGMIEALRADLADKVTDPFTEGSVIRWTSAGRYIYVAVKTVAGWYTTSNNAIIPKVMDYEELVEVLARADTDNVELAMIWGVI